MLYLFIYFFFIQWQSCIVDIYIRVLTIHNRASSRINDRGNSDVLSLSSNNNHSIHWQYYHTNDTVGAVWMGNGGCMGGVGDGGALALALPRLTSKLQRICTSRHYDTRSCCTIIFCLQCASLTELLANQAPQLCDCWGYFCANHTNTFAISHNGECTGSANAY